MTINPRVLTYRVEQGMLNPRDRSVGFRHWDEFDNLPDAIKCAKKIGYARILQCRELRAYDNGKRIKEGS